nr:hypothetical protein [Actinomadura sp. J1-007]
MLVVEAARSGLERLQVGGERLVPCGRIRGDGGAAVPPSAARGVPTGRRLVRSLRGRPPRSASPSAPSGAIRTGGATGAGRSARCAMVRCAISGGAPAGRASSAWISHSSEAGMVTMATVPPVFAASRTPTPCLLASLCTTGNPVCRAVSALIAGTGPDSVAFSVSTCVADMPMPESSMRSMTPPLSSRWALTVTAAGE